MISEDEDLFFSSDLICKRVTEKNENQRGSLKNKQKSSALTSKADGKPNQKAKEKIRPDSSSFENHGRRSGLLNDILKKKNEKADSIDAIGKKKSKGRELYDSVKK